MMHSSPPPAGPATAGLTCPWCIGPASPSPAPQTCTSCSKRFTLSPGPALDGSIVAPPPHPQAQTIHLKWSVVVTYKFARLDPGGLASGTLDPVVGLAPIDQVGIAWPDVVSIAVWRKLGWVDCIIGVLVPLPIALFSAWVTIAALMHTGVSGVAIAFAVIAIVFGLVTAYMLRRGAILGNRQVRIVGRHGTITVPFSTSPVFHYEVFRRCGLVPPPIP